MIKTIDTFKYLLPFIKRKIKKYKHFETVEIGFFKNDFAHCRQRLVFSRKVGLHKESIQFIIFRGIKNKCYKHIEL